ncbi:MAG TPA: nuclear transport factor 2 family protein [Luteimonas sp.]|nr:nuclear transport factor 2 family protein [Luteimonas sp.]
MRTSDQDHRRKAVGTLLGLPLAAAAVAALAPSPAQAARGTQDKDSAALQKRLDQLEARQQITDVLYRYARGWDLLDEQMLRSCFFDDAQHQHGGYKGQSQDFITIALPVVAKTRSTSHAISNVFIELRGDAAVADCYFFAHHRRNNAEGTDEEDYFLGGRYLDRFEKRDGVWKIARRRGLNSLERVVPRADRSFARAAADSFVGRTPDDPFYAFLAELDAKP